MDADQLLNALKIITTAGIGLFAGTSIYIGASEIPVWRSIDINTALKSMRIKFDLGKKLQGSYAIASSLCGAGIYYLDREKGLPWLAAGGLMFSIVIYSGGYVNPSVAKKLTDPNVLSYRKEAQVRQDLEKYFRLHAVRTLLSVAGLAICLFQLTS